ncbi:MAG: VOC family protein [Proteobacteria bacterium]|nr:VOC family protein [Pseudomonadota bacterium]
MQKVQGIGGIFIRAKNREGLARWYREHLGVPVDESWWGGSFEWSKQHESGSAATVWSVFPTDTKYFGKAKPSFMINYRVADLDAMRTQLIERGCQVDEAVEESEFGRFGWVTDPEGNRVELWEPPTAG